ncbi:MAG TPA: dihydrofolate reductase family protein [Acidimicrobiales bacterium]|nr:dihydrofolate reductase family protein [Acidimicrobiales bacterium]
MRIVIQEFISLDGVVQAPGGPKEDTDGGFRHGGWSGPFFDPEVMGSEIGAALERAEALLQGGRTWRVMASAWPGRAGDPFADHMNSIPKYVVSDTVTDDELATWSPTERIPVADLATRVAALREQPGGEINVMGSPSVVRGLLAADLVDELFLMIEPIVLGGGKSIWSDDGVAKTFELTSVATTATGVQVSRYQRAR